MEERIEEKKEGTTKKVIRLGLLYGMLALLAVTVVMSIINR